MRFLLVWMHPRMWMLVGGDPLWRQALSHRGSPASRARVFPRQLTAKPGQHRENAPVVVRRVVDAKLGEDAADVGFHGFGAQEKPLADGTIRTTLRHQR